MRRLLLVLPGLADRKLAALGERTPLEAAQHPLLDHVATRGRLGRIETGAAARRTAGTLGLPALLGLDAQALDLRRGPLEAAGLGIELAPEDLALRLNFVSTLDGCMADTRAGFVTDQEAALLIDALRTIDVGGLPLRLHCGSGYRHLAVVAGGARLDVMTEPPHHLVGNRLEHHRPRGRDAGPFNHFLDEAALLLARHDVNRVRVDLGENPADAAWLWGEGAPRAVPPLAERFGASAALVAAAPLVRGLGLKARMAVPTVRGATADERTDLAAKAKVALEQLEVHPFVVVHVAAVNEASRSGDARRKVAALERVDRELLAPLVAWIEEDPEQRMLLIASDASTSVEARARAEAFPFLPFAFLGGGMTGVRERRFTEEAAQAADLNLDGVPALVDWFCKEAARPATA